MPIAPKERSRDEDVTEPWDKKTVGMEMPSINEDGLLMTDEDDDMELVRTETCCIINRERTLTEDINDDTDDGKVAWLELEGKTRTARRKTSFLAAKDVQEKVDKVMAQVEKLVDTTYDILAADILLAELKEALGEGPMWTQVLSSPVFERFSRKLDYFGVVGEAVCTKVDKWLSIYADSTGTKTIHVRINPKDPTEVEYRVRAQIPSKLTHVVGVANEIELLPRWNSLVVGEPKTIGRRTAHYMVLNYQMSAVAGFYKIDIFNEIRRFADPDGGFLAEYIEAVPEDHPSYCPPPPGFKRPKAAVRNVWIAAGPEQSVFVQIGKAQSPFSISPWVAKTFGAAVGRFIIGGLVNNSLRASQPGNPWEQPLAEDKLGFYASIDKCVESAASKARAPKGENTVVGDVDLEYFFSQRKADRFSS